MTKLDEIPANARRPRKPVRIKGGDAWYYVEQKGLSLYADQGRTLVCFKLTRRQLEQALAVMDAWP